MTVVNQRQHRRHQRTDARHDLNLVSVGVLFVMLVTIAVLLIELGRGEVSPLWLLPPAALGFVSIIRLRS